MKLFELVGVKKFKDFDLKTLVKSIANDFKFKGGGSFAQVFETGDNTIYKFWVQDSAYDVFIDYVQKNQNNPHLPKLKSPVKMLSTFFKVPVDFPDKIKYVKLEKLTHGADQVVPGTTFPYMSLVKMFQGETAKDLEDNIDNVFAKIKLGASSTHASIAKQYQQLLEPKSVELIKEIFNTLQDIKGLLKNVPGGKLDIFQHGLNYMFRDDKVVVFTDPIYSQNDIDLTINLQRELEKYDKLINKRSSKSQHEAT